MSLADRKNYMEQCTRCSQCKFVPMPKSKDFSSICPSIDYGQFHAYCGGGKVVTAYGYLHEKIEASPGMIDSVYACTMCGACDTACKTHFGDNVEPFDTLLELRARMAKDGKVPPALKGIVENLTSEGAPGGKRADRSKWTEGLEITDAREHSVDVLLHVGSNNAYDAAQWDHLRLVTRLLGAAGVDFGILYDSESDSGGFAYELGYREIAASLARNLQSQLAESKATVLLAADADSYSAFRNIYPRLGLSLEPVRVLHTTEFVDELITSGRLSLALESNIKVAMHDSCRLGRRSETFEPWEGSWIRVLNTMAVPDSPRPVRFGNHGNYETPRRLLSRIQGLELVELERNRQFAYCCGGGAGVKDAYPEMADMAALNCLREAESTGVDVLISGSACCQRNMTEAAQRHDVSVSVRGLFDVLSEAISERA